MCCFCSREKKNWFRVQYELLLSANGNEWLCIRMNDNARTRVQQSTDEEIPCTRSKWMITLSFVPSSSSFFSLSFHFFCMSEERWKRYNGNVAHLSSHNGNTDYRVHKSQRRVFVASSCSDDPLVHMSILRKWKKRKEREWMNMKKKNLWGMSNQTVHWTENR